MLQCMKVLVSENRARILKANRKIGGNKMKKVIIRIYVTGNSCLIFWILIALTLGK